MDDWTKMNLETLCVICDAPPGKCSHNGHRYHDEPVRLIPVTDEKGKHRGYKVHPDDQQRWDAPLNHVAAKPQRQTETPKPIAQIIVECEAWMELTTPLEQRIRTAHERSPLKTTRAVNNIIKNAEAKTLTNPAGLLITRLREIEGKPPE